tara:strand:+ start:1402 stop:2079 length:678 start_codon:yes stop_codon:yes gene_type:complete
MKKLQALILDDEPLAVDLIEKYCEKSLYIENYKGFTNSIEALAYLKNKSVDVVFLDIQMPDLNGLEFGQYLTQSETPLIFTTAYREFGPEAFDLKAIDYLLKPISYERFSQALDKLNTSKDQINFDDAFIVIRANRRDHKILEKHIIFIQGIKDYVKIKVKDSQYLVRGSLGKFLESHPQFIRIHKSYALNPKTVLSMNSRIVQVEGASIPVGAFYRTNLKNLLV